MRKKRIKIDGKEVQKLASYGLNNTEIAEFYNVSEGTIRKQYSEFLTKGRSNVKMRLKKKQIDVAMKGNVSMLIWLGKQYLGQSEKAEEKNRITIVIVRKRKKKIE